MPIYYAHENTGRPATVRGSLELESADVGLHGPDNVQEKYTSKYLDLELGPQFAFGHGSGYASFAHGDPRLSDSEIDRSSLGEGGTVILEIDVSNVSARSGDEVVQVYLEDIVATMAPPVRRLIAFDRRTLAPGETTTVLLRDRPSRARLLGDGCRRADVRGRARPLPTPCREHARHHSIGRAARQRSLISGREFSAR